MHLGVCYFLERPADGTEFASGELPLHVTVLVARVTALGAVLDDPQFAGEGYRAHVTWPGKMRPALGPVLALENLSLIDLEPDGDAHLRRVITTF